MDDQFFYIHVDASNVVNGYTLSPVEQSADAAAALGLVEVSADVYRQASAALGQFQWVGGALVAYVPPVIAPYGPVEVPPSCDPRQFFQALVQEGRITQADCLAYLQVGTLPPPLVSAVNALPAAQQFAATCLLVGAQSFLRANPIVPLIGAELSPPMASADLDALWTLAASL